MTSFIDRLFRKKPSHQSQVVEQSVVPKSTPDQEILSNLDAEGEKPATSTHKKRLEIPQLVVGVGQSVGIQRDHNEDALFTMTTNLLSGEQWIHFGLYIIADGMGGHENGELASSLAVRQLTAHVIRSLYLPILTEDGKKLDLSIQEVMQLGVVQAHQKIKNVALGGGTTLTSALILGDQLTIAHVGDSRAYLINPQGAVMLLTHDHSLVKRLEEIGQISPEQASTHPQRNVLYRALGQGELFEPDINTFQLEPGSYLLLCTDGLWGVIPEDELVREVLASPEPQIACQELINSANTAGGPDNISVIIIRIPE